MGEQTKSVKHGLISKNNSKMLIALAVAGAVLSFTLVSGYTLVKRIGAQNKVISQQAAAERQLKANLKAVDSLITAFKGFDTAKESVIGTSDANSKIVLDALPSKYDFPAVTSSLEKLLLIGGFSDITITGSDSEATAEQNSANPVPIEIPFTVAAKGSYENIQTFIANLQRSIRPFKIQKVDLSATQSGLTFTITAVTYYQPTKSINAEPTGGAAPNMQQMPGGSTP